MKRITFLLLLALRAHAQMSQTDVETVLAQAITRAAAVATNSVIAVVDREGFVLGVWSVNGTTPATNDLAEAIARAGTAAFLSSDQHAFTSRTALMIAQQHFPPGVRNKPPGPLVGVNFSQLPVSDINHYKDITGAPVPSPPLGGLDGFLGGVPLYKAGKLVGGVGVVGGADENVALAGQIGFAPARKIRGTHVFIDGIRLPYVATRVPKLAAIAPLGSIGINVTGFPPTNSPTVSYPSVALGGVAGEIRSPIMDDPNLSSGDVTNILTRAAQRAATTRAGIRLPRGQPAQVFISVVSNGGTVLGTFRTGEATMFSWDVSVQKARTALYFSSGLATNFFPSGLPVGRAYSTRAIGFLSQALYPPGIAHTTPGPLLGVQEIVSGFTGLNPLNGVISVGAMDANLPNGITIFAGGFPLYKSGVLVGAIGVSGDGIDQDDLIAATGAALFPPPPEMRSDQIIFRGARLPYAKFPRNPNL